MSRIFNAQTLKILKDISKDSKIPAQKLHTGYAKQMNYKEFYNTLYRMHQQGLLLKEGASGNICLTITDDGKKLLKRFHPERDGIWKLIIFDIPEKQKYIRVVLRAKLKALHFKKWQNSIWVSPYALDEEIEEELNELAKKIFVRLIKTKDINYTEDLEKLFS